VDVLHPFLYLNTTQCLRVHPITVLSRTLCSKSDAGLPDLFFQKGQTFSKKGQKRPTKLLKKDKHSIQKGLKEPNLPPQFVASQLKFT